MGLVSSKDFVLHNAVETILSKPKKVAPREELEMEKPTFGKVPKYLTKVKATINKEQQMMREYQERMEAVRAGDCLCIICVRQR